MAYALGSNSALVRGPGITYDRDYCYRVRRVMDRSEMPARLTRPREIHMARDPVCGMEVNEETATNTSEYEGTKYYFCCGGCKATFDRDPEKFTNGEGHGGHGH